MKNEMIMVMLPLLVPYLTAALKTGLGKLRSSYPIWFKPFRPLLAGALVAAVSKAFGVPLPSDLMQITDGDILAIVTSGVFVGMGGAWLHTFTTSIKQSFGPDQILGAVARLVSENPVKNTTGPGAFRSLILLPLLLFTAVEVHAAGRAVLTWDQNTESDLAGYKVYHRAADQEYGPPIDVGLTATPQSPTFTVEPLADGTYLFAVTAYDDSGNESGFSNEVSKKIDTSPPSPPTGLRAIIERIIAAIKKFFGLG